jgi:hypothetical protein
MNEINADTAVGYTLCSECGRMHESVTACPYVGQAPLLAEPPRQAWICPRCLKVNAPHMDQCDCKPTSILDTGSGSKIFIHYRLEDQIGWGYG